MSRPDWSVLTHVEKIDALRPMVLKGYSSREMAGHFDNATRNAVISFIHRYKLRASHDIVAKVRKEWKGHVFTKRTPKPRRVLHNNAKDELTRKVIEAYDRPYPFRKFEIQEASGVSADTIRRWRSGEHSASEFLANCVLEAIEILKERYKWDGGDG